MLKDVSLSVPKGAFVVLLGQSGAGKSTLLHVLATLEKAQATKLHINGVDVQNSTPKKLAQLRNTTIGFVFQFHNLIEELTALENVCLPAYIQHGRQPHIKAEATEWLKRLGVGDRLHHTPSRLSGGEAQRVAVARALINQPQVVFADEPSGNLDSTNADSLHTLLKSLNQTYQQAFIIATHNEKLCTMADHVWVVQDGTLHPQ